MTIHIGSNIPGHPNDTLCTTLPSTSGLDDLNVSCDVSDLKGRVIVFTPADFQLLRFEDIVIYGKLWVPNSNF